MADINYWADGHLFFSYSLPSAWSPSEDAVKYEECEIIDVQNILSAYIEGE